jgi:hypothetical protein
MGPPPPHENRGKLFTKKYNFSHCNTVYSRIFGRSLSICPNRKIVLFFNLIPNNAVKGKMSHKFLIFLGEEK